MKVKYSQDKKTAFFDGYKFRQDARTGYYLANKPTYQGKRERLHVYVWRYFNGPVSNGYHIHHKDKDKSHNDIENLECILQFDHLSLHGTEHSERFYDDVVKNLMEYAVPKAAEWHSSEEGKKWHSEHAKITTSSLEKREYICENCGKHFWKKPLGMNKFCSNNCKAAARRRSGVDNETRTCSLCGKGFIANKYSTKSFCSRECRNMVRKNKVGKAYRA